MISIQDKYDKLVNLKKEGRISDFTLTIDSEGQCSAHIHTSPSMTIVDASFVLTKPVDTKIAGKTLVEWKELVRRDDVFDNLVPSDLRQLLSQIKEFK